jgi:transposase
VWDGSGLVLLSKRLERGRFTWPPAQDGVVALSAAQLSLLFFRSRLVTGGPKDGAFGSSNDALRDSLCTNRVAAR